MINSPFTLPIFKRYNLPVVLIYQLTTFRINECASMAMEKQRACLVSVPLFCALLSLALINVASFYLCTIIE